ncbi:MAG: hypothetical protein JNJ57_02920 [Saprospiraceae bacterium]|nr:hypothetical protein [Saprospiraceae bacterium]
MEWKIIKQFSEDETPCFSLEDAKKKFSNESPSYLENLLVKMVNNKKLVRLQPGLYYIVPLDQEGEYFIPNWHMIAKYIMRSKNYYIGYYSALQIHKLITQPSVSEIVVTDSQVKPSKIEIRGVRFQFIYHNQHRFFGYEKTWIDDFNQVNTSDLEKTLVDSFINPHHSGGMVEIAKAEYETRGKVSKDKIIDYFTRAGSKVAARRYAFICKVLNIDDAHHKGLLKNSLSGKILRLDTSQPDEGKINTEYELRINRDLETIQQSIFS